MSKHYFFWALSFLSLISFAATASTAFISPRAAQELRKIKHLGAVELNSSFAVLRRRGDLEFIQAAKIEIGTGELKTFAFLLPPNLSATVSAWSLADFQDLASETAWVTISRAGGIQQMDFSVRRYDDQFLRVQSRYAGAGVSVRLDPQDARHLFIRLGNFEGDFLLPASVQGDLIGFESDRRTLWVRTSLGTSFSYLMQGSRSGLLFEPQSKNLFRANPKDVRVEVQSFAPPADCSFYLEDADATRAR